MKPLTNKPDNSSARLEELLEKTGKFKPKGRGLTEELKLVAGVSYTTARKWLYEDAVPRTSEERIRVANTLGIDLLYWEYGFENEAKPKVELEIDHVFHMKLANTVLSMIHEKQSNILSDKIIAIELLAIEIAKKTGNKEPDVELIKSLIDIAN